MSLTKVTYSMIENAPINVIDYGAVGDGVTNDTTAIQNALNIAGANKITLILNDGTYAVTGLTIPSNVTFEGQSLNSTLKNISTGVTNFVTIDGTENVTVKNITFDTNNKTGADTSGAVAIVLTSTSTAVNNTIITGCKFINGVIRAFIDVRNSIASTGLTITDNQFYGQTSLIPQPPPAQQNTAGVRVLSTASVSDIKIDNNYFSYIDFATQIRPSPNAETYDFYKNISWSNNVVTNVLDDTNVGATPLEIFGATNVVVDGNRMDSGGRGLSAAWVKNGVYNNNTLSNQKIYFIEVVAADGITVSNNTALNCKRFLAVTGTAAKPGTQNVNIVGNVIKGGNLGIVGYNTTVNSFAITMTSDSTTGHKNWVIADNSFIDFLYSGDVSGSVGQGNIIRIDSALSTNFLITNNSFVANDELMGVTCINVAQGSNIKITDNSIVRTADITSTTYASTLTTLPFISVPPGTEDVLVENNFVKFTGVDTRSGSAGAIAIGHFAAAGALSGAKFARNKVVGAYNSSLNLRYTSGNVIVEDNDLVQATGTPVYDAAVVFRRIRKIVNLSAIPTTGTWERGDTVLNVSATSGQPAGWMCTVAGTPGTWAAMANLA